MYEVLEVYFILIVVGEDFLFVVFGVIREDKGKSVGYFIVYLF